MLNNVETFFCFTWKLFDLFGEYKCANVSLSDVTFPADS